jgi:ligand-binding sensor domain-containing protein
MAPTKAVLPVIIVTGLALVLAVALAAPATSADWTSYTSQNDVRRMRVINDTLWCATSGGLLGITDTATPGIALDNLSGIGSTALYDIIADPSGRKWIAAFGRLVRIETADTLPYVFLDNNNHRFNLYCLADDGDHLWVGTQLGLVLFSKSTDGGQIQDSYGLFGNLNAYPSVLDIMIQGDSIWIGTSAGLGVADKSNLELLKSPASWRVFSRIQYPLLGSDTAKRVVSFENTRYFETQTGVFRLDLSTTDTTITRLPVGPGYYFTDLRVEDDSLFIYSGEGIAVVKNGIAARLPASGLSSPPRTGIKFKNNRWLGLLSKGIYYGSSGVYAAYPYTGMPDNNVTGVTVSRSGVMTALFYSKGAARIDGGDWVPIPFNIGDHTMQLISDSAGNDWAATWGKGLWRIAPDDSLKDFEEGNSTVRGIVGAPYYSVVTGVATDGRYLFGACYRARNGYPVAVGRLDDIDNPASWDSLGIRDGILDTFVVSIDYRNGYLAVATEANGLYRCYIGPDPSDRSDDTVRQLTLENSFLRSNTVRVVRFSPEGELWVGTNFGLSRFDPGLGKYGSFVNVDLPAGIGPDITDIEFDARSNVWVAANNGAARIDAVTGDITLYTTQNSGLVSDEVHSVTYDSYSGEVYFSTSAGISRYRSTFGRPSTSINDVVAFPNPFVIRSSSDVVGFNYAGRFSLRIFSLAGELIRETSLNTWDGRNQSGDYVTSGVYFFVLTSEDGSVGRGKILVVRQ